MGQEMKNTQPNPFPGLRPFSTEESDLFFGREEESNEIVQKLLKNRFVAVMGASGIGKSSLVRCGIIPKITRLSDKGSPSWKVLSFSPSNDPAGNLVEALTNEISGTEEKGSVTKAIYSLLGTDTRSISRIIKDMVIRNNEKVLILIDQFEELFRYNNPGNGTIPENSVKTFITLLENAVEQTTVDIYIVITMRSEFIDRCAHFQRFTQLINKSNYVVPRMNRESYRSVIEGPVQYAGASIDPDLVEIILNDIEDRTDQLPVLQHAMMRTWSSWEKASEPERRISFIDYESAGTLSEAMSGHADEIFGELTENEQKICEKLFKAITDKGSDNRGLRRPASIKSIASIIGYSTKELSSVIEKFRAESRSFITPQANISLNNDTVIDLAHESLIRLWYRLKQWVDEEADSVRMYLLLSEASELYQKGKASLLEQPDLQLAINWRDREAPTLEWAQRYNPAFERTIVYLRTSEKAYLSEQEKKRRIQQEKVRRTKRLAIIFGGVAVITAGLMLIAFLLKVRADRNTALTEARRKQEEHLRQLADSSSRQSIYLKNIADSIARLAILKEEEISEQKRISDMQRDAALNNISKVQRRRELAEESADSARLASIIAVKNEDLALIQKDEATRLRMLSIGKSMSLKSLQFDGEKDLQTLLAYQAYLFNSRNKGHLNDADIYHGLYNVAKQYGNVNYKTFSGYNSEIRSIAFVPGKREFFTSGVDGKILQWDLDNKDQNFQVIYSGSEIIDVLSVSPDAEWLACGADNASIRMIPINGANAAQYELKGHTDKIKSLVFSYDGRYLYSASLDGKVLKWDLIAKTSVSENGDMMQINYIDISANGNYLAGVSDDGKVLVWDPEERSDNFRIESPGRSINSIKFRPESNTLAVGYNDGYIELWDIAKRRKIYEILAHSSEVKDIRFNNPKSQMASAGTDGKLKLWDLEDLASLPVSFNDNDGLVVAMEFSPDGQFMVSATNEGPDIITGRPTSSDMLTEGICENLTRNMTPNEWIAYVGKDIEYERTCYENEFRIRVNIIK